MKSGLPTAQMRRIWTRGPSSDFMKKCDFYGRKNRNFSWNLGCPRRQIGAEGVTRAQIMRKCNFYGRKIAISHEIWVRRRPKSAQKGRRRAQISWENAIFTAVKIAISHEIWARPRPKSTQKPSPSSDHEKINFYGRIAIFMKLGAHGPNRRRSRPPAQIMRKSIFTVESQFSWNWVAHGPNRRKTRPRAQIMRKSIFTVESQFSWNWVPTAQIGAEAVPQLRSWENQFLRSNRNFHEIGCPRPKSAQNPSPSSDHEKINFYGRIAIFMKLGAHGPNRRRSRPPAQIMRKSIFTVESQFSWNWVPTAQIGAEAVSQLRSWENQFLRPNRNFHEIRCPRPKWA